MNDLHQRYAAWIADGASGDPARDVAVHAVGCDACRRLTAAIDALSAIDVGAAPEPPRVLAPGRRTTSGAFGVARAAVGLAAVTILAVSLAGGFSLLRTPGSDPVAGEAATPTPFEQEVLGGVPASATPRASDEPTPGPSDVAASETSTPTPTPAPTTFVAPRATVAPAVTPPPAGSTPSPNVTATAVPTAAPTPTPVPTPVPTPTIRPTPPPPPTPIPTAAATPTPAPTPAP